MNYICISEIWFWQIQKIYKGKILLLYEYSRGSERELIRWTEVSINDNAAQRTVWRSLSLYRSLPSLICCFRTYQNIFVSILFESKLWGQTRKPHISNATLITACNHWGLVFEFNQRITERCVFLSTTMVSVWDKPILKC